MIKKNTTILLLVIAVAVIVAISIYCIRSLDKLSVSLDLLEFSKKEELGIVPPLATGNIDDAIDSLLKELADIESLFIEEEEDAELIISDMQEISDFGQSIDESEL